VEEELKSIIILSGPVGAGKTTVGKELVKLLDGPVVYIEGDTFWFFIAKDADRFGRMENFKMVMRSMTVAAMPYCRVGYQVVLDFSITPWYMGVIIEILKRRNIPVDYVVLNPGEAICAQRTAERPEGKIADYSVYKKLYDCFNGVQKYTIHDEENDPLVIAGHIVEGLNEGMFRILTWKKED
jgi:predicted kinase